MRILHVITSLEVGGAERSLKRLIEATEGHSLESAVACLRRKGAMSDDVVSTGARVEDLGIRGASSAGTGVLRLRSMVDKFRPDLIQGWMYHGNLAASLGAIGTRIPVVWNIRTSLHHPELFKRSTRLLLKAGVLASRLPDRIIYNSKTSLGQHEEWGFPAQRSVWIPNGVPRTSFSLEEPGQALRRELRLGSHELLGLSVGRLNVVKGYDVLLKAIEQVEFEGVRFVVVGRNIEWSRSPFREYAASERVRRRLILLPETRDIGALYQAADFLVSPSLVEAFPNVVAEAMEAGLPCVATDVGDVRHILGDSGFLVSAGDAGALAKGVEELLRLPAEKRERVGAKARERVRDQFSEDLCHSHYLNLYRGLLDGTGGSLGEPMP